MIVTHYNPWLVRGNAQAGRALDRFFNGAETRVAGNEANAWTPHVDVREEAARFVILADLPGIDPSSIEIQTEKNVLSLKGERKADEVQEGTKLTRSERASGSFDRRFTLPESVDADGITAAGRNGVLEISIPKKPQAAPRRVAIHS